MKIRLTSLLVLATAPLIAHAEVADKMPSVPSIYAWSALLALVVFGAARLKWWLVFPASLVPAQALLGIYAIWEDPFMHEAVVAEFGFTYYGALLVQGLVTAIALAIGTWQGRKRHAAQQRVPADVTASRGRG